MKKNILLAVCISAVLLLAGCSSPEDTTKEEPVLDFPTTEDYSTRNVGWWIENSKNPNSSDPENSIVLLSGLSFKLYNGSTPIEDAELSSSDRSVIEIYNKGFVSTKKTGHVKVTLKSKSQNIDMTFSAFVMSAKITVQNAYTEISVEIPEGIGCVEFNRKSSLEEKYQVIGSMNRYSDTKQIDVGTYKFKDYFIESNKKYDYSISAFSASTGWGNGFFDTSVKTNNTGYGELKMTTTPSFTFDGKVVKLENLIIPEHPSTMKAQLFLTLLKDNNVDDKYTYGWDGSKTELDLYEATNSSHEYLFRGKNFTVKGIDMYFYDNTQVECTYRWYPVYPEDMTKPKAFPVSGDPQIAVAN